MSIGLSFSNPIISFKTFNSENKSKPSIFNTLLCFKYFSFKEDSHVLSNSFSFIFSYKFIHSLFF